MLGHMQIEIGATTNTPRQRHSHFIVQRYTIILNQ